MPKIRLSEDLYDKAKRRAAESGYDSVDQYVAEILKTEIIADTENFDDSDSDGEAV